MRIFPMLGVMLVAAGSASSSENALEQAGIELREGIARQRAELAADPQSWPARVGLIRNLVDAGDLLDSDASKPLFAEAMERSVALAAAHPDSAEGHYLVALSTGQMALFVGGKDKVRMSREIKTSIDRAIALDPGHAKAHVVRGVYYRELATLNLALRLFAKVFFGGLPPGSLEDSVADLELALALDPADLSARYNLARTLWRQKATDAALRHCELCIAGELRDPLDPRHQADAVALKRVILRQRYEDEEDF